jgi:tetratricopeptide (TPR) repeat protein
MKMMKIEIKRVLLATFLIFSHILMADSSGGKDDELAENISIVEALLSEENSDFAKSQNIFLSLYDRTSELEYLIQASKEAMMYRGGEMSVIVKLRDYLSNHKKLTNLTPARMIIALYAKMGNIVEAEKYADLYFSEIRDVDDMRLLATIKSELKKYREALKFLQKAYEIEPSDRIVSDEVAILDRKLGKTEDAISLIRKHIESNRDVSMGLYFKLLELYTREKRLKEVLKVYKELYEKDQQKYFLEKIVQYSLYNKDIDGLIEFLEKHKGNERLLYLLYKEQDRFDKAISLAKSRYQETKKPNWLAEEAILMYEKAHQQKNISPETLKKFQKLFDKALKEGIKNGVYLNYYGYILIDHDLNIERGIKLVKLALEKKPNNSFYLDSLAWGLYKLGKCKEAYKIMKKVIAKEGILQENEIKIHWESIRECNKNIHLNRSMF